MIDRQSKEKLIQRDGNICSVCGRNMRYDEVQIEHIIPKAIGGTEDFNNLRVVCRYCNSLLSNREVRGYEFQNYIYKLMEMKNIYVNLTLEKRISRNPSKFVDIYAEQTLNRQCKKLIIECKSHSSLTIDGVRKAIYQLEEYKKYLKDAELVLAFPGQLSDSARELVKQTKIEIWDISYLAKNFKDQIEQLPHPILQTRLQSVQEKIEQTPEDRLIERLKKCKPGRGDWSTYQKLVGEILERLFCPPLLPPDIERSDASNVNRRDFIFPNYAEEGFWAFVRNQYSGDYIVVDAKNYSKKIGKQEVLQIANYLKSYGAGLFALIICRNGGDTSCIHTLREVWAYQKKLIIVLTDDEIEQMLKDKSNNLNPENIIREKIREFRLDL